MTNVYEVEAEKLIKEAKEELKKFKELTPPEWAEFVKTGVAKERAPQQKDWWYIRAASMLRKLYILNKPIGVRRMRKLYSSRKNRGVEPEKSYPGSGSITRKLLQSFEKIGFVEKTRRGRMLTPKGRSFLDKIAAKISKASK